MSSFGLSEGCSWTTSHSQQLSEKSCQLLGMILCVQSSSKKELMGWNQLNRFISPGSNSVCRDDWWKGLSCSACLSEITTNQGKLVCMIFVHGGCICISPKSHGRFTSVFLQEAECLCWLPKSTISEGCFGSFLLASLANLQGMSQVFSLPFIFFLLLLF